MVYTSFVMELLNLHGVPNGDINSTDEYTWFFNAKTVKVVQNIK